jgi:hypothetical protein
MSWVSQVSVNTGVTCDAGWCLWLAEECVGAPHWYATAKIAANNAEIHADRNFPTDAVVALFWDWTSKTDGVNYGHVVINVPGRGLFSSPKNWGVHGNDWYGSIDEVSRWLGASYIGWSPVLAGKQLAVWNADAAPVAAPVAGRGDHIAAEGNDWTYWVPSTQDQATVQAGINLAGFSIPVDGNLTSDASIRAIKLLTGKFGFFDLRYFDGLASKNLCHGILLMAQAHGGYSGRMDWQIDGHVWAAFDTAIRATAPAPAPKPLPVVVPVPVPVPAPAPAPKPLPVVVDAAPTPVADTGTPVVDTATPAVDVPVVDVTPVNPPVKETPVSTVNVPIPVRQNLTEKEVAAQKAQIAALPAADLGAIIANPRARKIAYTIFAALSLVVTNTAIGFSTLGVGFPGWLTVALGVIGNLAVPFSALAIANSTPKTTTTV